LAISPLGRADPCDARGAFVAGASFEAGPAADFSQEASFS
jgi:hypothetical protein